MTSESVEIVYMPDNPDELEDAARIQGVLWQKGITHLIAIAAGRTAITTVIGPVMLHGGFNGNDARIAIAVTWDDERVSM